MARTVVKAADLALESSTVGGTKGSITLSQIGQWMVVFAADMRSQGTGSSDYVDVGLWGSTGSPVSTHKLFTRDPTNYQSVFGAQWITIDADGPQTIEFGYVVYGSHTVLVRNVRIIAVKLTTNGSGFFDATSDQTDGVFGGSFTNSTTYVDLDLGLDLQADGVSSYLALCFGNVGQNATGANFAISARQDGTEFNDFTALYPAAANETQPFVFAKLLATPAAGTYAFSLHGKTDNAAKTLHPSGGWFFLRLDGFDDVAWVDDPSYFTSAVTTYETATSLTHPLYAGDYLGLFTTKAVPRQLTTDGLYAFSDGATLLHEFNIEGVGTTANHAALFGLWFGDDQAAGDRTLEILQAKEPGNYSATYDRKIALLALDVAVATDVAAPAAALTLAVLAPAAILDVPIHVPPGTLELAAPVPSAAADAVLAVAAAALLLAAPAPATGLDVPVAVPQAAMGLSAAVPRPLTDAACAVPAAPLLTVAAAPRAATGAGVTAAAAALAVAGLGPSVLRDIALRPPAAGLAARGQPPKRAGPLWRAAETVETAWTAVPQAEGIWTPAPGA
ncbi:MAG: hypothetical protein GC201_11030 [Alphaproteobacteria bacterium]|nr:hypothetical protein [Alphaproteobacteria bacterium]